MKKIAMGNDHSAVEMKEAIKAYVEQKSSTSEPIPAKAVTTRHMERR